MGKKILNWFQRAHMREHLSWTQTWGLQDVCQSATSIHVNPTVATVLVWQPVETGLRICLNKKTKSTGWSRCYTWTFRINLTVVGNYLRLAGCAVWNRNNETAKTFIPLHPHPGAMIKKQKTKHWFASKLCHRASNASSLGAIVESSLLTKFKQPEDLSLPGLLLLIKHC